MNWLLIILVLMVAGVTVWGYKKGFMWEIYTLVRWILVLAFVFFSVPFLENVIVEHTPIPAKIEARCLDNIREKAQEIAESKEEEISSSEKLNQLLPAVLVDKLASSGSLADTALDQAGVYEGIAKEVAKMAVKGLAYIIALILSIVIFFVIERILHLVEKIPVLKDVNAMFGAAVGLCKGFLYLWIGFAIVAATAATKPGMFFYSYISESPVLKLLFDYNPILLLFLSLL